jgi:hypothetical protein
MLDKDVMQQNITEAKCCPSFCLQSFYLCFVCRFDASRDQTGNKRGAQRDKNIATSNNTLDNLHFSVSYFVTRSEFRLHCIYCGNEDTSWPVSDV